MNLKHIFKQALCSKALLLFTATLLLTSSLQAQLSGTYTIDNTKSASSTNYTSFSDAVDDLLNGKRSSGTANGPGVKAAVVFNVANGLYEESIEITSISGADATNTVTFQSASKDSSKVTLEDTSNSYTVFLNGAAFITFKQLTIRHAITNGHVIQMDNFADSNHFYNNRLIANKVNFTYPYNSIVYAYSYSTGDSANWFVNNYMANGNYGIFMYANYSNRAIGNKFIGNTIRDVYYLCMYVPYQDAMVISKNKIYSDDAYYGIYSFYFSGTADSGLVSNNFITLNSSNYVYPVMMYYADMSNFYSNNIVVTKSSNSYCMYLYNYVSATVNVMNNNLINKGGGYALYVGGSTTVSNEDYNNMTTTGSNVLSWNYTNYATVSAWKSAGIFGLKDTSLDPKFRNVKTGDLHVAAVGLNNIGYVTSSTPDDIDGEVRSSTTPDIGADEFTPAANDIGCSGVDSPSVGFCVGKRDVWVTVTNYGTSALTSAKVDFYVDGVFQSTTTLSMSANPLGIGKDSLIKIGSYNFSSSTKKYLVKAVAYSPNGVAASSTNTTNDADSGYANAGISGTYTIDATKAASGTNYQTFNAAVSDLVSKGVCAAVTYNVADGTYMEQVLISKIGGASAKNTVTFQSAKGDSSKVILDYASSSVYSPSTNFTLSLQGASYVTFRKMTIQRSGSGYYGNVLDVRGGSHFNTFTNNIMQCRISGTHYSYVIYSGSDIDSNNTFSYNGIYNGYYDVYWMGTFGGRESNNLFYRNRIDSCQYYGAIFMYQNNLNVRNNIITGITQTYGMALYLYYVGGASRIDANKMILNTGGYYGVYSWYFGGNGTDSCIFSNNFVSASSSTAYYGMYLYYGEYLTFIHNNLYSENATGYTFYYPYSPTGTAINSWNNNFIHGTNTSRCIYVSSTIFSSGVSDYNNYGDANGLSTAQGFTSQDLNSLGVDPKYTSKTDLHVKNVAINGMATPSTLITKDIDGQTRNTTTPDIGADEFFPAPNDAGISAIDSPGSGFCGGKKDIYVRITNFGTLALSSVSVSWSLNGTAQTPVYVNMSSNPLGQGKDTSWKLGSYTFTAGATIKMVAFTTKPNGATDTVNVNDTSKRNVGTGLKGTYSIGGTSPDYTTFTDAAKDLSARGVCGAVVMSVADGTYKEQFEIDSIGGSSATNTVTFTSKSGDSSKVILDWPSGGGSNYTIFMNGTDYTTFSKMTISRSGSSTNAYVIIMNNGANYNRILNNRILSVSLSTYTTTAGGVYSGNGTDEFNQISNNYIYGGYAGIYMSSVPGYPPTTPEKGNIISGNKMEQAYYNGIYAMGQDSILILKNTINDLSYTYGYALMLYYVYNGSNISKNKIYLNTGYMGMYLYNVFGNQNGGSDSVLISNNMMSIASSFGYGIYAYNYDVVNFYYNSFASHISSTFYPVMYLFGPFSGTATSLRYYNNNVVNLGGGYAVYGYYNPWLDGNYNNIYTIGSNLGYYSGTTCATLADWQTTTGQDLNSKNYDPSFAKKMDLHVKGFTINDSGTVLVSVKDDIDGQPRSTTTPDIGADEYTPPTHDLSASAIVMPNGVDCGDSNMNVAFRYHNYAPTAESGYKTSVTVIGLGTASTTSTSITASGDTTDMYTSTGFNTYKGGKYTMIGKVSLVTDVDKTNDSVISVVEVIGHANNPSGYSGSNCSGSGPVRIIAQGSAGDSIMWWDSYKGGNMLAKGDTFTTPSLTKTTIYWAQAYSAQDSAGEPDPSNLGTSYRIGYLAYDMVFDALQDMVIDSLTVYPEKDGDVKINITDASGKTVGTRTYTVSGLASSYDPVVIPVKIKIAKGKGYHINPVGSTVGNMTYNYYAAGFKYSYKNRLISITGNSLSANYYWFFFWNWKVSNNLNCPSQRIPVAAIIGVGPKPTASYSVVTGCSGKATAFSDKSSVGSGGSLAGWSYNFGDGSTAYYSATTGTTTHVYANAGTYKVTLTVTTNKGCTDTMSKFVVISPKPTANFSATTVCMGSPTVFTDNSTGTGAITYAWDFGDKTTDTKQNPSHSYASAGTYNVTLVVNDAQCSDTFKSTVEVYPVPNTNFGYTNACLNTKTQFLDSSAISSGKITSWGWSFGVTGATDTLQNPTYTYTKLSTFTVSLTTVSDKGCSKATSKTITIDPTPTAAIDSTRVSASTVSFDSKNTANSYLWEFGDGSSNSTLKSPSHFFIKTGTFKVKLTTYNANGCSTTDSMLVAAVTNIAEKTSNAINLNVAPNPFTEATNISYSLNKYSMVEISVYDVMGRKVQSLNNGIQNSGDYKLEFRNQNAGGVYIIRMVIEGVTINKEVISVK